MALLVDDLLRSYGDGYAVNDHSLPSNHADHAFRCRALLLLWCGDYQGQAKISNMKHAGAYACHWCLHKFIKGLGTTGSCFADNNRRYAPPNHPYRADPAYGADRPDPADNVPPPLRTAAGVWATGEDLNELPRNQAELERMQALSGVNGICILHLLPLFDMIMDICLDMMHVIKNVWQEHLFPLFKGEKIPKKPPTPAYTENKRPLQGQALATAKRKHAQRLDLHEEVKNVQHIHTRATHMLVPYSRTLNVRVCVGFRGMAHHQETAHCHRRTRCSAPGRRMVAGERDPYVQNIQGGILHAFVPLGSVALFVARPFPEIPVRGSGGDHRFHIRGVGDRLRCCQHTIGRRPGRCDAKAQVKGSAVPHAG
jgi:hypothetical protein